MKLRQQRQQGFSLLELMVVLVIFLIVSGAVFELLNVAQLRYRAEQQFLESFQGARLGVDLMVRDIHNAGYPPPYTFPGNLPLANPPTPATYPGGSTWEDPLNAHVNVQGVFALGFVGVTAGAVSTTCLVDTVTPPGTCTLPNPWDLVIETDLDPERGDGIEWVRYNLVRTGTTSTLYRTVTTKEVGPAVSPVDDADEQSTVPFVEDIVQDPGAAISATNPPVFTYECDPPSSTLCLAEDIKNVIITLQVQSTRADLQTGQFRQIRIQGAASRQYPAR